MFRTYDPLSNISLFHIDEMEEFTPWRRLKTRILKSLKRQEVPGRQIVWDFGDPSGWDKYHKQTWTQRSKNFKNGNRSWRLLSYVRSGLRYTTLVLRSANSTFQLPRSGRIFLSFSRSGLKISKSGIGFGSG